MTTQLHSGVSGQFIFRNAKTNEISHVIKNKITDMGMKRLASHCNHNLWAFAENFHYLFLGVVGSASSTATPGLLGLQPERSTNPGASFEINHLADPTKTKTTYAFDLAGNLVIDFFQSFNIKFYATTDVREIGVGPAFYTNNPVITTPVGQSINHLGQPWYPSGVLGLTRRNNQTYPQYVSLDEGGGRVSHTNDPDIALWSRATVPLTAPVIYNDGDDEDVTYQCTITICKEIAQLQSGFSLDLVTLPVPVAAGDQLPPNITGLRSFPFYPLNGARTPANSFQGLLVASGAPFTDQMNTYSFWEDDQENCPPFFENLPFDASYGDVLSPKNNTGAGGTFLLDFYSDLDPVVGYSSYTNTITATSLTNSGGAPIPLPIKSTKIHTNLAYAPVTSFIPRYPAPTLGRTTQFDFWQQIDERTPASMTKSQPGPNTWETKVRFLVKTKELNATGVKSFHLWRANSPNQQVNAETRGYTGLHTALSGTWIPTNDKVLGLDYTFSWTRL